MSGLGGQADIRAVPEDQSTGRVYAGIVVKTRARPRQRLGAGVSRLEFIRLLSGAAVTWPAIVRAQQTTLPVVGFINGASPAPYAPNVNGFLQGLKETGYIEGQNVTSTDGRRVSRSAPRDGRRACPPSCKCDCRKYPGSTGCQGRNRNNSNCLSDWRRSR